MRLTLTMVLRWMRKNEFMSSLASTSEMPKRMSSPQVRTLLVTGETSAQRITDIRASGVPFLHKPVRAQQLLEALAD